MAKYRETNYKTMMNINPELLLACDDIAGEDYTIYASESHMGEWPKEQQLCFLHLASMGTKFLNNPKNINLPQKYQDAGLPTFEHLVTDKDIRQQKLYKKATEFVESHITIVDGEETLSPFKLTKKFPYEERIAILFIANLRGFKLRPNCIGGDLFNNETHYDWDCSFENDSKKQAATVIYETMLSATDLTHLSNPTSKRICKNYCVDSTSKPYCLKLKKKNSIVYFDKAVHLKKVTQNNNKSL